MKAGIARRFAVPDALEEGVKRMVLPQFRVLQHLAVDVAVFRHGHFDFGDSDVCWQQVTVTPHSPGFPAFTCCSILDMAAEQQGTIKQSLLFRGGLEFAL